MNIEQLKKQAKNLKSAYPALVTAHGENLSLSQAQAVIAQINGFPSWELMVRKRTPPAWELPSDGIFFADSAFHGKTARAEVTLQFTDVDDEDIVGAEDSHLADFIDQHYPIANSLLNNTDQIFLAAAAELARECLLRAPHSVYLRGTLGAILYAQGLNDKALEILEPMIAQLIASFPRGGRYWVDYSHYPEFFDALYALVWCLDRAGRHEDADSAAKLGVRLSHDDMRELADLCTRAGRLSTGIL